MDKIKKMKIWMKHVILSKNNAKIGLSNKILAIKKGFSSDFFQIYNLNKNNIDDYISEYKRYLSREINGDYKFILDDKIVFTSLFEKYVNVPKILIYILDNIYYDGKILKDEDIINVLSNKKTILKPINDGGGHGVHLIELNEKNSYIDYEKVDEKDIIQFIKNSKNCIVTEYVKQAKYSENIFDKTVNTIRIITIRNPKTGKVSIPCAVHRFGNANTKGVDNVSSGGYVTEINIDNGKLGLTKKLSDLKPIEVHPNSKAKIKDVIIPNWKKIIADIIDVANKFPYLKFIAWDVVVTEKGFYILEANTSSSLELFQIFNTLKNTELWDFYKYYKIIK